MKTNIHFFGSGIAIKNMAEVKMNRTAIAMALMSIFVTLGAPTHTYAQIKALGSSSAKIKVSDSSNVKLKSVTRLMGLKEVPSKPALMDVMKKQIEAGKLRADGGVDTGGGTLVISKGGQKDLLDLVNFAPSLLNENTPGVSLPKDSSFKEVGIQLFKGADLGLYQVLKTKIGAWRATSPYSTVILEKALDNVPLYFFNYKLGPALVDQQAFGLSGRTTEPVARYVHPFGVLVSRPDFEALSAVNQQALIIHETLRHITIAYKYRMTDENLQRMTAAVMSGPNHASASLDSAQNISEGWTAEILRNEYERLSTDVYIDSACKILEEKNPSKACLNLREKNRSSDANDLQALKELLGAYAQIREEMTDWMLNHPGSVHYSMMDEADQFFSRMIATKNGQMMKLVGRRATDDALTLDQTFKVGGAVRLLNDPSTSRKSYYDIRNALMDFNRKLIEDNILIEN